METSQQPWTTHRTHSSLQRLQHERRNDSTTRGNAGRIPVTPQCVRTHGWVNGAEPQRHKRALRLQRARPYRVGPAFTSFHGVGGALFTRLTNGRRRPTTRGVGFVAADRVFKGCPDQSRDV